MSYAPSKQSFGYSFNDGFDPSIQTEDVPAGTNAEFTNGSADSGEPAQATGRILAFRHNARNISGLTPPPRLLGDETGDEEDLEVPRILLRNDAVCPHAEEGSPEPEAIIEEVPDTGIPQRQYDWTGSDRRPYRPGIGAFAFVALAIAFAGGGAAALGLSERIGFQTNESGMAETAPLPAPAKTTAPTSENTGTGLNAKTLDSRFAAGEGANVSVSELQAAKDRLTTALASAGRANSVDTERPVQITPAEPAVPPAQPLPVGPPVSTAASPSTESQSENGLLPTLQTPVQAPSRTIPLTEPARLPEPVAAPTATAETEEPLEKAAPEPEPVSAANQSTDGDTSTGQVTVSVNLRAAEDKNSEILAVVPQDAEVVLGDCGKWWCAVSYDGHQGFIGKNFVRPAS